MKKLQTNMVRGGTRRSQFGETSEAIFMNSGFRYDTAETAESRFNGVAPGFVYSRYSNPTLRMLEERLILLEEGSQECIVTSSGMAAVFAAIMCKIKTGDHLIANKVLFGSCHYIITQILPRMGVEVSLVSDGEWEAAFRPNTTMVFLETPSNPTLDVTDIKRIAGLCKKHNALLIVDNIFATPLYQKPLTLGADVVIYSLTKHIDGGGRTLGGAVLGSKEFILDYCLPFFRHTGPALSPFNAWVLLKALESFELRVNQMTTNAEKIVEFLAIHPKIERVIYPRHEQMKRGSNMVAFYVKGGKEGAFAFLNKLQTIDISNNLGDSKTLITHPATTTHSNIAEPERLAMNITAGLLRMSVGLENSDDLIEDIKSALME
jgi:O-succinylhomoserine sulfhydrylase